MRVWWRDFYDRFLCVPYNGLAQFLAKSRAKSIPEEVAYLISTHGRLLSDDPKVALKAARECSKSLAALRLCLIQRSKGADIDPEALSELFQVAINSHFLEFIVDHMLKFEFEARKDAVFLFNALLNRHIGSRTPTADYIISRTDILLRLLRGYEQPEISLNYGLMLRECLQYDNLTQYLLECSEFFLLFEYVQSPQFDVASDAFATMREMLIRHKMLVAAYLIENYDLIIPKICHLLKSDNYVCRRQSLKLLGELLRDEKNSAVMMRFIDNPDHLKLMMNLLKDKSKNIQLEAFHIFKLFVASPYKTRPVYEILLKNQRKLVDFLEAFRPIKEEDDLFDDEKRYILRQIMEMIPSSPTLVSNRNSTASQ